MEYQSAFTHDLAPLYEYDQIVDMRHLTPQNGIHYANCNCYSCQAAHFPCEDWTCEYCTAVRSIRDSQYARCQRNGYEQDTLPYVNRKPGGIIDYLTWIDEDKPSWEYMLWETCDYCELLISADMRYDNGGYCNEQCEKDYKREHTYWCGSCGDTKVDREYGTCIYCKEEQSDYNEEGRHDGSGFECAEKISVYDYHRVKNCWIDPQGYVRYVPYCNHDVTARAMGFSGTTSCENAGYVHVSIYWNECKPFVSVPDRPTMAQIVTIRRYAEIHNVSLPEQARYSDPVDKPEPMSMAYSIVQSCLPRKLREVFYPLAGD